MWLQGHNSDVAMWHGYCDHDDDANNEFLSNNNIIGSQYGYLTRSYGHMNTVSIVYRLC